MKTILIATHNKGKLKRYKELFASLSNLKLITLEELGINFKVDEPFNTPEENSAHKAREYGKLSQLPTIAIDEAVLTNFLPAGEQPGVMVRRFRKGHDLSDLEILEVWQEIFSLEPNDNRQFIWDFRLSYYNPESGDLKTVKAIQTDTVTEKFSKIIDPGYPMSSFLVPLGATKTYSELSREEYLAVDQINLKTFLEFMKEIINENF